MDIYARLNIVALNADNQKDALNYHLSQLLAMAKKEKFQQYRDLIYYAAAELEIRQKQYKQAEELLKKSIQFNDGNIIQKSKSYYLISETQYKLKKYIDASNSHDSITIILLNNTAANNIDFKKGPLKKIALALIAVNREDSLQRIASLPETERILFLKTLLKRLRKEKGIKETDNETSFGSAINNSVSADLFGADNLNTGFYFTNNNLKTKGLSDFKAKWGNRPNIDNWRRQSAVDKNFKSITIDNEQPPINNNSSGTSVLSMESLMDSLPLTNEKLQQSNKLIGTSLLSIAMNFQFQLNDFNAAIDTYEMLSKRFSESSILEEVWFQLNYCYKKNNELDKADSVKQLLNDFYPKGKKINYCKLVLKLNRKITISFTQLFIINLLKENLKKQLQIKIKQMQN